MANGEDTVKPADRKDFEDFLEAVQKFFPLWCDRVRAQSGEREREAVMRLYETAIENAWGGASEDLLAIYHRLDLAGRAQLDRAVAMSGMLKLVEDANDLLTNDRLVSTAALLDLGTIVEKIKWFIQCIFGCLGIDFPCILECLFKLLDNFIRLFVAPVSRDYADFYLKIEKQAAEVRMQMQQEQKLRKGCACGGSTSDQVD